jgi:hypothetical protein
MPPIDQFWEERFSAALAYFDLEPPRTLKGQLRLQTAFAILFPGFSSPANPGNKRISDEQKAELHQWVEAHKTPILKTAAAVVRQRKQEILARFPWLAEDDEDTILNRVSQGKAALPAVEARKRAEEILIREAQLRALEAAGVTFPVPSGFARPAPAGFVRSVPAGLLRPPTQGKK